MELTQDEKGLVILALRNFSHANKQDLDRAEKDTDWAKRWAWVLHKTKTDYDMAQGIIAKLENQKCIHCGNKTGLCVTCNKCVYCCRCV